MATATLHVPQDMSNPRSIDGDISYSPTEITVVDGNFTATYFGTFTYDMGDLTGGTVTGFTETLNGIDEISATDGSMPALDALTFIETDDLLGLYGRFFRGRDEITGSDGADVIRGFAGRDTLVGGEGADILKGGRGSDNYYVDDSGDIVVEKSDHGDDRIYSSISFELPKGVEKLFLQGTPGALNGTGNMLDNKLTGNKNDNLLMGKAGNDTLDGWQGQDTLVGGEGADILKGGRGSDNYYVDDPGDIVVENSDSGDDRIYSSISFELPKAVEKLFLQGTPGALNGTGNMLRNKLTGNKNDNQLTGKAGNDTLDGRQGNDTLQGGSGNDTLDGWQGNDMLQGGSGKDALYGSRGKDTLEGGSGDDALYGSRGKDTLRGGDDNDLLSGGTDKDLLWGGEGNDVFEFLRIDDSRAGLQRDVIKDFVTDEDLIDLRLTDANADQAGDQAFIHIGDDEFSNTAGELRWEKNDNGVRVMGDVDGDANADFSIQVKGLSEMSADDFIL